MQPTLTDVHVNAILTNLSLAYFQEETNFVAQRVFPSIPVAKKSDTYFIHSRADFNRNDVMRKRAPGTESAGGGYKLGTGTYAAEVWAGHKDIDDQIRANADSVLSLDMTATRYLVQQALISREIDWASKFFAASVWTGLLTGVAGVPGANQALQWNDPDSDPIRDIRTLKRTAQLTSGGFRPNKAVLGRITFDTLIDHPDFVERVKYGSSNGSPAKVALQAIAELFELDEVLIMDGIYNTGVEGVTLNANESNAFIGNSKSALLLYVPSNPGIDTPAGGLSFNWTGFLGATSQGNRMKTFYMDPIASTRIEIETAYDHRIVGADMGSWLATIVA